jgi:PEGA domain
MRRLAGVLALFVAASLTWAGEAKQYPLTLKVLETDAVTTRTEGTKTTTNCTSLPGSDDIDCTSRHAPGALHTDLISIAEASDGNTYSIACTGGAGARFAQGFAAGTGNATVSGCMVPPGTYKARWDKGHLKVLHEKNGKSKETTFTVLSSKLTARTETAPPAALPSPASSTLLRLSSNPTGADIELDGSFVGQTPSSVPAAAGVIP